MKFQIYSGTVQVMPIGQNRRRLLADYRVEINGVRYTIPKGFEWDGASVPRLFWSSFGHPFDDIHMEPGMWHDAAYSGLFPGVTRDMADDIYYAWIRGLGQSFIKAKLEYRAIRWFGESHWTPGEERKGSTSSTGEESTSSEERKGSTKSAEALGAVSLSLILAFLAIGGCASLDAALAKIFLDEPAIIISTSLPSDEP